MEPSPALLPRYFWSRVVAIVVDYLFVSVISLLIMLPLVGNSDKFRLDSVAAVSVICTWATPVPDSLRAVVAPQSLDGIVFWTHTVLGRDNGLTATLIYGVTKTEHTSSQRSISIPIDKNGNPVAPLMPQTLINAVLLIVVGGTLLRRNGQTPGKRLMGLKVVGVSTVPGILREVFKSLPVLIMGLALASVAAIGPGVYAMIAQMPILQFIGAIFAYGALVFWLYLLPVLRWRGTTRYDRWLGLTVVLA